MCVWHIGAPCDQSNLHWLAILRIGTLHSGIFLLAIVRGGALERAGGLGNCALEAKSARGSG